MILIKITDTSKQKQDLEDLQFNRILENISYEILIPPDDKSEQTVKKLTKWNTFLLHPKTSNSVSLFLSSAIVIFLFLSL